MRGILSPGVVYQGSPTLEERGSLDYCLVEHVVEPGLRPERHLSFQRGEVGEETVIFEEGGGEVVSEIGDDDEGENLEDRHVLDCRITLRGRVKFK